MKNRKHTNLNKKSTVNKKIISLLYDNDIMKKFQLYLKMKKEISIANKMYSAGKISEYNYKNYLQKIKKENELSKKRVDFLDEVLFETDDCILSSVFEEGSIKYCINQYGMKDYYNNLEKAIENFVRISL